MFKRKNANTKKRYKAFNFHVETIIPKYPKEAYFLIFFVFFCPSNNGWTFQSSKSWKPRQHVQVASPSPAQMPTAPAEVTKCQTTLRKDYTKQR